MRRYAKPGILAALAAAVAALAGSVGVAATGDPLTCAGYPEPRVLLESQAGWSDDETSSYGAARHVHTGVCVPYRLIVDGQVSFDIVSKLHNYAGWMLRYVRVQAASDQYGVKTLLTTEPRQVCSTADCTFTNTLTVDVSGLAAGIWEFRFHSEARPGVVHAPAALATNGWQVCVRSCSGVTPQATDTPEGRGWYKTDSSSVKGYVNGKWTSAELPGTVSGTACFPVQAKQGSGDEPAEASFVSIDPNFHAAPEDPGLVLIDQPGPFAGSVCVDTTALANGPHKLMIRAYSSSMFAGQLWGSLVVPFTVLN